MPEPDDRARRRARGGRDVRHAPAPDPTGATDGPSRWTVEERRDDLGVGAIGAVSRRQPRPPTGRRRRTPAVPGALRALGDARRPATAPSTPAPTPASPAAARREARGARSDRRPDADRQPIEPAARPPVAAEQPPVRRPTPSLQPSSPGSRSRTRSRRRGADDPGRPAAEARRDHRSARSPARRPHLQQLRRGQRPDAEVLPAVRDHAGRRPGRGGDAPALVATHLPSRAQAAQADAGGRPRGLDAGGREVRHARLHAPAHDHRRRARDLRRDRDLRLRRRPGRVEVRQRGDQRRPAGIVNKIGDVLQPAPGPRCARSRATSRRAARSPTTPCSWLFDTSLEHGLARRWRPAERDGDVRGQGRPAVGLRLLGRDGRRLRQAPAADVAAVHLRRRDLDHASPLEDKHDKQFFDLKASAVDR